MTWAGSRLIWPNQPHAEPYPAQRTQGPCQSASLGSPGSQLCAEANTLSPQLFTTDRCMTGVGTKKSPASQSYSTFRVQMLNMTVTH